MLLAVSSRSAPVIPSRPSMRALTLLFWACSLVQTSGILRAATRLAGIPDGPTADFRRITLPLLSRPGN